LALSAFTAARPANAQTGTAQDSTVLGITPSTLSQGESVALTAEVEPAVNGGPVPTGKVVFSYSGNPLATVALSSGVATFVSPTNLIPPGTYAFVASYSGDSNYAASVSTASTLTVSHYTTSTVVTAPAGPIPEWLRLYDQGNGH
jgi:hypothetical protein